MKKSELSIIEAAIALYNERGLANVRNQDIAEAGGMSLSNFNYHFKNKNELVVGIYNFMMKDLDDTVYKNHRRFIHLDGLGLLKSYLEFQVTYKFFFLDSFNIMATYPAVKEEFLARVNYAKKIVINMFYMGVGKGYMHPVPDHRPNLFEELWDLLFFKNNFLLQYMTMTDDPEDFIAKGYWCSGFIIDPYLTDLGRKALKDLFEETKE